VFSMRDDIKLAITRQDIVVYPMPVKQLIRGVEVAANLRDYIAQHGLCWHPGAHA